MNNTLAGSSTAAGSTAREDARESLSFSEELIWLTERRQMDPLAFIECPIHLSLALRMRNRLDVAALRRSFDVIVQRHAVLRSRFVDRGERPQRAIRSDQPALLPQVDLRALSPQRIEQEVDRLLGGHVRSPFDLEAGPLFRGIVVTLDSRTQVVAITIHHIVFDGWSRRLLARELSALYAAHAEGSPCPLPRLAAGYTDYVRWQRSRLENGARQRLLDAWTARLGDPSPLRLPSDQPPGRPAADRPGCWRFSLPAGRTEALRALSRNHAVTVANSMLALFTLLLHKLSGAEEAIVGVPISDRRRPEFEDMIGLFTNVLVVRTELGGAFDFPELLRRVRQGLRAAYGQQDLHYWQFVKARAEAKGEPPKALYQVVFNFMSQAPKNLGMQMPGLEVEELTLGSHSPSLADLSLHARDRGDVLDCRFDYKTEMFSSKRIAGFAQRFEELLAQVLDQPLKPLSG